MQHNSNGLFIEACRAVECQLKLYAGEKIVAQWNAVMRELGYTEECERKE